MCFVCVGFLMCGFCNAWMCVHVGFIMCVRVCVCMCGFGNVWVYVCLCVCVGLVMRGCVYVWVL